MIDTYKVSNFYPLKPIKTMKPQKKFGLGYLGG